MTNAKIRVFRNGRYLKTVDRPVHQVGSQSEVTYRGVRYPLAAGNLIEVGQGIDPVVTVAKQKEPASIRPVTGRRKTDETVMANPRKRSDAPGPDDWTDEQRKIIRAPCNARLIVEAAPGTGKTAVACARIAYLLSKGVSPTGIWLISFTRTAIQEIRNRIAVLSNQIEGAYGVKIATIDSHAWQLRQGFDGKRAETFASFEKGIDDAIEMLDEPGDDLIQELESIEHLIIDEAQDVVGKRKELLIRLVNLLPRTTGITVLGDSAQAIFGFTEDDAPVLGGEALSATLQKDRGAGFEVTELTEVIRTSSPGLHRIFIDTRRVVLHEKPASLQELLDNLRSHSDGNVSMQIQENGLAGRDDVLVLYRNRAEVLTSGAFLASSGTPFRVRMSGYPVRIAPWLASVFWNWTKPLIAENEFRDRYALLQQCSLPASDAAWKSLVRHAGKSNTAVDVRQLRRILSRPQPPLDFASPELGDSGPILGTIHASKGREAEEVHLMLSDLKGEELVDPEELRVVFVGATRARRVLKLGQAGGKGSSITKAGRRFRSSGRGRKAQVEIGRQNDFDCDSPVSALLFETDEAALLNQRRIEELNGTPVSAKLVRIDTGGNEYESRLFLDDSEQPLGRFTDQLNKDIWQVIKMTAAHRKGGKVRPPMAIKHIFLLCNRTIVREAGDPALPQVRNPWAQSGFWLAPVIFAYSTLYFADT